MIERRKRSAQLYKLVRKRNAKKFGAQLRDYLQLDATLLTFPNRKGNTLLLEAAMHCSVDAFNLLLDELLARGLDVNGGDNLWGRSVLMWGIVNRCAFGRTMCALLRVVLIRSCGGSCDDISNEMLSRAVDVLAYVVYVIG